MNHHPIFTRIAVIAFAGSVALIAKAQSIPGLPEPGLVMYGAVTNANGPMPVLQGNVQWTVVGGGSTAVANGVIANVNGQYFYVARVPFETRTIPGISTSPTPNTLPLTDTATTFTRSARVLGTNATIVPPAIASLTFGKLDRGKVERVNLSVALTLDPSVDSDGDGVPDWAEAIAGTNPNDPASVFKVSTDIQPAPGGGLIIRWTSVPGRSYSLFRTSDVGEVFGPLVTGLSAISSQSQYIDSSAIGEGPFFYRVQVSP